VAELVYLGAFFVTLGVPFLIGRKVRSTSRGIAASSVLPLAVLGLGLIAYFDQRNEPVDSEWAGLFLLLGIVVAVVLEVAGLLCFGLGRLSCKVWRPRQARDEPLDPAGSREPLADTGAPTELMPPQPEVPW
jgi:hypothetical protein